MQCNKVFKDRNLKVTSLLSLWKRRLECFINFSKSFLLGLTHWGRQGWEWWELGRALTSNSGLPLRRELATLGRFWLPDWLSFLLLTLCLMPIFHPIFHNTASSLVIDCDLKLVWQGWTVDSEANVLFHHLFALSMAIAHIFNAAIQFCSYVHNQRKSNWPKTWKEGDHDC